MKFLKWILNGLIGMVTLLGLSIFVLRLAGISSYAVLSGSMEPEISTGGIVFTNTRDRQPETGDVITYRLGGTTVTHRILRMEDGAYVTKGDANQGEDTSPVLPSQIVGTVCFSLPFAGYVVSYLHNGTVLLLFSAGAALSLLLESRSVFRTKNQKRKNKKGEHILECAEKRHEI